MTPSRLEQPRAASRPATSRPSGATTATRRPSRARPIAVIAAPPGRLVQLAREALAPGLGQRVEPLEGQVEEDGPGADDVDRHEKSSASSAWRPA